MQEEIAPEPRPLCVLGPFQPFGLTAERLHTAGKEEKYTYSLFDPELARSPSLEDSMPCDNHDEELFIHGNCVMWSAGLQVRKRFSAPSAVVQTVWCRFNSIMEPVLSVLYSEFLATFTPAGEMTVVPLPHVMASLWPIPCGLLLQRGSVGNSLPCSIINPANESKLVRNNSTHSRLPAKSPTFSHFALQHPLEEPQVLQHEQDGMIYGIVDVDERIIWTSSDVSYVASYHNVKLQHSVWRMKFVQVEGEASLDGMKLSQPHAFEGSTSVCLERVWQDEVVQTVADQVFLATDDDGVPILCFLMKALQSLFAFRLFNGEATSLKVGMAWTIPAISAAPTVATRPWLRQSGKQFDLIILAADGSLSLYRGKYRLCQLYFPWSVVNGLRSLTDAPGEMDSEENPRNSVRNEYIIGLCDPVQGRVNVITSSGQLYRCSVSRLPASALAVSCMMALDEGLQSPIYNHFLASLWGHTYSWANAPAKSNVGAGANPDLEWASFADTLMQWCKKGSVVQACKTVSSSSAWDFLLNSTMHKRNKNMYAGLSAPALLSKCDTNLGGDQMEGLGQESPEYTGILSEVLMILHAVYEDHKLDSLHWRELHPLSSLLGCMSSSLCEWNYLDHYARDFPDLFELFQGASPHRNWQALKVPFNIFQWLERCMRERESSPLGDKLPFLYANKDSTCVSFSRKVVAFYELLACRDAISGVLPSGVHVHIAGGSFQSPEQRLVLAMVGEGFGLADLDRLPAGVSLPLRHALNSCREAPPPDWPESAFVLVGREDLASMCNEKQTHVNVTCIAAPYMLHLRPVPVISSESDSYENINTESISSVDLVSDGMEHMFNGTIQLRFGRDLRLNEVRRLLCSSRPVAVRMANPPDVSDPDIVAQQQAQLWQLAQRTTSLAFGRGAFTLATMRTLLTEVLTIPKLVLAGRLPSQHDATVNLDSSTGNLSDLTSWPEYHNGVAAGLRLAPCQDKITRTWIVYNRPDEPSFAHAGLLMSLGLQGHLRVLAATDVYRYLSQEHEATTVGILLGMAAAHKGTMDPAISKILYLHIPARHPPSFPELELPTLMQSAALMAVGMLYQGSAHRLTTEILLAEIGRKPGSDNVLEREGYALAAGLALGLVTLGKGKSAWGLADLSIEERLLHYMSGGTEPGEGRQQRFDGMANNSNTSKNFEDLYHNNGQVMEGSIVNLDVTAPGATLALGLMFLKTNSEEVALRLATPDTHFALEYVRPDFILIRVVARNLVLWDSVKATEDWVQAQIPAIIKESLASSTKEKEGSDIPSADVDMEALAQAHVNILAGACLSIGLRYAGTSSADAQQLLYRYALYFLKEKRSAAPLGGTVGSNGRCLYVDRGTLETCLNVAILSLSVVMAGSGHLGTFKLLRYLRRRNDVDSAISYGNHMAVSMAIGFLFLGSGTATFATNNNAVAALLIALYPRFPTAPNDHRCHLQAFRHLYVLATEARCIQTIDVDTGLPVYAPLEVTLQETSSHSETTFCHVSPCLLPERCLLKRVRVCGPRYWPQDIRLTPCGSSWWESNEERNPFDKGVLLVKRKVGARSYGDDPIGCRSLLSRTLQKHLKEDNEGFADNGDSEVDKIVSTFSPDPSLLAFSQVFCASRQIKLGSQFEEFCLQALLECVSSDKPALLQAYLSFYTVVEDFIDSARGHVRTSSNLCCRSLSLCSLKVALAYSEAVGSKVLLLQGGPLLQQTFLAALAKQIDDMLNVKFLPSSVLTQKKSSSLVNDLMIYLKSFQNGHQWRAVQDPSLLTYYLRWYDIPSPALINNAFEQLSSCLPSLHSMMTESSSSLPLLALVLPGTATRALIQINQLLCCSDMF